MTKYEVVFFWFAVGMYVCSSVAYVAGIVFQKERYYARGGVLAVLAFVAHTVTIAVRWVAVGHMPVMWNYENAIAGSWLITLFFLVLILRNRRMSAIGIACVPVVLLMMGYGISSIPKLEPLHVTLNSGWLYVHIIFAWFAYSSYVIAFALSVLFLIREKREPTDFNSRLPDLKTLDQLSYRFVAFGFIMDAVMIAAGAIWANMVWGSYWSWDPIETWSLVSWLIYALYLHLRVTMGWRNRRAAWLAVFALSGVIISFWGVNFITSTVHDFSLR